MQQRILQKRLKSIMNGRKIKPREELMKELRRQDRMVLELPKLLPGLAFLLKGILCLNPQKEVGGRRECPIS